MTRDRPDSNANTSSSALAPADLRHHAANPWRIGKPRLRQHQRWPRRRRDSDLADAQLASRFRLDDAAILGAASAAPACSGHRDRRQRHSEQRARCDHQPFESQRSATSRNPACDLGSRRERVRRRPSRPCDAHYLPTRRLHSARCDLAPCRRCRIQSRLNARPLAIMFVPQGQGGKTLQAVERVSLGLPRHDSMPKSVGRWARR